MRHITILGSCIMDVYLFHLFCSNYLPKSQLMINRLYKKVMQIITVLFLISCNYIGNGDVNIIVTPLVLFLYMIILFGGKFGNKILCFSTVFCVLYGCEFLFMIVFHPSASDYKNSIAIMLQIMAIKFLSFIIILIINQLIGKRKKIRDTRVFLMYMLIPVSSLMVMLTTYYTILNEELSLKGRIPFVLSFVFLLVGNIVSFYAFESYSEYLHRNLQQNIVIIKQKKDLEHYMQIADIDKKQKELIHNISNQMRMISHFADQQDYKTVLKISGEINEEIKHDVKQIFCNNTVLNSILNEKKREAEQYGIVAEIYVEPGIILNISISDMISLFGNLLDNAIRAAAETEQQKYIKVFIYMHDNGGFCVVKIVNSFNKVILDRETFLSTKAEEGVHGIGIRSVNRIAEKYGGYLNCSVKSNEFVALLLLSTEKEE